MIAYPLIFGAATGAVHVGARLTFEPTCAQCNVPSRMKSDKPEVNNSAGFYGC